MAKGSYLKSWLKCTMDLIPQTIAVALFSVLFCYALWEFIFAPIAQPVYGVLFIFLFAAIATLLYSTSANIYLRNAKKQFALSIFQRFIIFLFYIFLCSIFFFTIDFFIHYIVSDFGLGLKLKIDDYYLQKGENKPSKLLPLGYQGVYIQLFFLPFSMVISYVFVALSSRIFNSRSDSNKFNT